MSFSLTSMLEERSRTAWLGLGLELANPNPNPNPNPNLRVGVLLAACRGGGADHVRVELEHARGGEEDDDLVPGPG